MKPEGLKLGELLYQKSLVDRNQIDDALLEQKTSRKRLGEVLVEKNIISDHQLTEILAEMFNLPVVYSKDIKINEEILKLFSLELLQNYKVFPIQIENNCMTVATNNPLDVTALQDIQSKSGCLVKPVMASVEDIKEILKDYAESFYSLNPQKIIQEPIYEEAPITELVNSIIIRAIKENASDIHLEPQHTQLRIRFRIDGILYEKTPISKELERNVISRIKIISGMDVAESRRPQDGRMSFKCDEIEYDIRLATLPNILGENLVLRILTKQFLKFASSTLGMDNSEIALTERLMKQAHGLVLLTGPTGAGKTTTLYSILNQLNQSTKNIISIEDPVEYELTGINQTAVNNLIGYSYASCIRHVLRLDPDIIMVGEIRDIETAETSIQAALTGHLVFATLHTNTAVGAITRLLEMDIEPFLIGSAVNGVIAQRLVRKLCPHCSKEYKPTQEIIDTIKKYYTIKDGLTLAKAVGCGQCLQTGYSGRVGIFEILKIDKEIRAMILKSEPEEAITKCAIKSGMKTLQKAGIKKAIDKETTIEEIIRITSFDD